MTYLTSKLQQLLTNAQRVSHLKAFPQILLLEEEKCVKKNNTHRIFDLLLDVSNELISYIYEQQNREDTFEAINSADKPSIETKMNITYCCVRPFVKLMNETS